MSDLTEAMMNAASHGKLFDQEREPYDDEVLMCGYIIKLGHRVKSWRHRWVVVRGNGCLEYFKQSPSASKPLVVMKPKGQINLRRDCLELITWNRCNKVRRERVEELGGPTLQSIRWPSMANEHSVFGIRTTYRTFFMVAPDGDAQSWINGLDEVCRRCDIYEGVDQLPLDPRRGSIHRPHHQEHAASVSPTPLLDLSAGRGSNAANENEDNDKGEGGAETQSRHNDSDSSSGTGSHAYEQPEALWESAQRSTSQDAGTPTIQ